MNHSEKITNYVPKIDHTQKIGGNSWGGRFRGKQGYVNDKGTDGL